MDEGRNPEVVAGTSGDNNIHNTTDGSNEGFLGAAIDTISSSAGSNPNLFGIISNSFSRPRQHLDISGSEATDNISSASTMPWLNSSARAIKVEQCIKAKLFSNHKTAGPNELDRNAGEITPVTPASPLAEKIDDENNTNGKKNDDMVVDDDKDIIDIPNSIQHPSQVIHNHEYPLAGEPTPTYLRSFRFIHNGIETIFQEDDINNSAITTTATSTKRLHSPPHLPKKHYISSVESIDSKSSGGIITPGNSAPLLKRYRVDTDTDTIEEQAESSLSLNHPDDQDIEEVEVINLVSTDGTNEVNQDNMVTTPSSNIVDDELIIVREMHGSPHMSLPSPSASPVDGGHNLHEEDDLMEHEDNDSNDIGLVSDSGSIVLASPQSSSSSLSKRKKKSNSGTFRLGNSDVTTSSNNPITITTASSSISNLINTFDELPPQLRRYVLYNLLKKCDRTSLSIMSGIIVPALRCDFLSLLPIELAYNILGYLDHKSLCRAAQVSRNWKNIVDSSEWVWKSLLEKDEYGVTVGDYRKAINEGWDYTSWGNTSNSSNSPTSSIPRPINIYKAIYRRKYLINRNWMNPRSRPKHLQVRGHGHDVVTCLQFDDERIITGSDDNTINVYDTKTGQLRHQFTGHDGGVWALKYINKRTLISGATDRTVRVWDIEKGKCTHVFYGHTSTVRCLDIIDPVQFTDPITGQVTYIPEEPIIVTGSRDATLRMWRLPSVNDEEYNVPPVIDSSTIQQPQSQVPDPYFLRALRGHTNSVRAISGYGDTVVSGSYDTTVRVWNISSGECRWELTGHVQRVYSAVLDHKRNRCISGSMDWFVKVWCIETGTLLYTLEGHTSLVGLLDLNRTTLVSAAADSTLRVWDPETGAFLHKLQGHQGAITCFQHDENKVVSGSEKTLKLWDIRSGDLIRDLLTDLSGIWQVCFDERRCVAAVKRNDETYIEVLDFDYDPFI